MQKISELDVLLWEYPLSFSVRKEYFWEKEIPPFPITPKISHSSVFFGKTIFIEHSEKRNMVFSIVQDVYMAH